MTDTERQNAQLREILKVDEEVYLSDKRIIACMADQILALRREKTQLRNALEALHLGWSPSRWYAAVQALSATVDQDDQL